MIDTLNVINSKAVLTWVKAYYGSDLATLPKHAPLWVTLSRNTNQAGQALGIQGYKRYALSSWRCIPISHVTPLAN
jgi:hypothetical protein